MNKLQTEFRCRDLLKRTIRAADGEIGTLKDIYFDDVSWAVRYLVVDTGHWLPGRKVLVSPHSLRPVQPSDDAISFDLTRQQIRDSPEINSDKPVSKQEEERLSMYYGWPPIPPVPMMGGGMLPAGYTYTGGHYAHTGKAAGPSEPPAEHDEHLRSVREVTGYTVEARHEGDERIGSVQDFVVDLSRDRLTAMVVEPERQTGDQELLLPLDLIGEIRWDTQRVTMRAPDPEGIRRSPQP